jgi:hypothetical protein
MTRKIPCIRVYSRYVPPSLVGMIAHGVLQDFAVTPLWNCFSLTATDLPPACCQATIYHDEADWAKTMNNINNQPYTITAVIAGAGSSLHACL